MSWTLCVLLAAVCHGYLETSATFGAENTAYYYTGADHGSGADNDWTCWRSYTTPGWYVFGDICAGCYCGIGDQYNLIARGDIFPSGDSDIAFPVGKTLMFENGGCDCTWWKPICPGGFTAIGIYATCGGGYGGTVGLGVPGNIMCLADRYLSFTCGGWVWNADGSGGLAPWSEYYSPPRNIMGWNRPTYGSFGSFPCFNTIGNYCPAGQYAGSGYSCGYACTPIANCDKGLTCTWAGDSTCTECALGYYLTGGRTACTRCPEIPNCYSVDNNCPGGVQTCIDCENGYYGDGTTSCTACTPIPNCQMLSLTCTNGGNQVCSSCAAGYYLTSGNQVCTKCPDIANCAVMTTPCTTSSNRVCTTCEPGYYGSGGTTCPACTPIANCYSGLTCTNSGNQVCATCAVGYYHTAANQLCTVCPTVAYCSDPAATCTTVSDRLCVTCFAGFTNVAGVCKDMQVPAITCPASQTFFADPGVSFASLTITAAASDNWLVANITNTATSSLTGVATTTFALGSTLVTFTSRDYFGNANPCSVTITVVDREVPVITCPADAAYTTSAGVSTYSMTVPTATATDNVAVTSITNTGPTLGTTYAYPQGITPHVFTAMDAAGNKATCLYRVNVTVNCGPMATPAFGVALPCPVTTYERTCSFTCNTYYTLFGTASRACLDTAQWSGSTVVCNDVTPPYVTAVSPTHQQIGVARTGTPLVITFSEPMDNTTLAAAITLTCVLPAATSGIPLGAFTWNTARTQVTITLGVALPNAATCTVRITNALKDAVPFNNALYPVFESDFYAADTVCPTVVVTVPYDWQAGVIPTNDFVVTFDEPMNTAATVAALSVQQYVPALLAPATLTTVWSKQNTVLTVTAVPAVSNSGSFQMNITQGARDVTGNLLCSALTVTFLTRDYTKPFVISVSFSSANATSTARQPLDSVIVVTFSKGMNQIAAYGAFRFWPLNGPNAGTFLGGFTSWDSALTVMTVHPFALLESQTFYQVKVDTTAVDLSGNTLLQDYTATFLTVDVTPPTVNLTSPIPNAPSVLVGSTIMIRFDKIMDPLFAEPAFSLFECPLGACNPVKLAGTFAWSMSNWVVTFTPTVAMKDNTPHQVVISTACKDFYGNALVTPYSMFFTTEDLTPPQVISFAPPAGTVLVSVNIPSFTITFSKPMNTSAARPLPVTLTDGLNPPVQLLQQRLWSPDGTSLTVYINQELNGLTNYTISVLSSALDAVGHNLFGAPVKSSFQTINSARPRVVSIVPPLDAYDVAVANPIVVTFSTPMSPASASAVSLSPAVPLVCTFNAANTVLTCTHGPLATDTHYTITVDQSATDLTPLPMLNSFTSEFDSHETLPPTVVSFDPPDNTVGFAPTGTMKIIFSVRMNPTSQGAISLTGPGGPVLPATILFLWTDTKTLTFVAPLLDLAHYTLTVSTSVVSAAGNFMATSFTSSFTTVDPSAPTVVLSFPARGEVNVPVNTANLWLRFSVAMFAASVLANTSITSAVPGQPQLPVAAAITMVAPNSQTDIVPGGVFAPYATVLMTTGTLAKDQTFGKGLENPDVRWFRTMRSTPVINEIVPPNAVQGEPIMLVGTQLYDATCANFTMTVPGFPPLPMTGTAVASVDGTHVSGCEVPIGGYLAGSSGWVNGTLDGLATIGGPTVNLTVAPSVTSVVPQKGPSYQLVDIYGTSLFGATCADFTVNGVALTGTANITADGFLASGCSVPFHLIGTVADLRVTVGSLQSTPGAVSYFYSPVVQSISPPSGFDSQIIAVAGVGFLYVPPVTCTSVFVNGVPCTDGPGNVVTDTLFSACRVPYGAATDPVDSVVTVTVAGQTSPIVRPQCVFSYKPYVVAITTPGAGPGGAPFTIRARHVPNIQCNNILFKDQYQSLAAVAGTVATTVVTSPHTVDVSGCLLPNMPIGHVANVSISIGGQTSNTEVQFSFRPHIYSVTPTFGVVGDAVTINGMGFISNPIDVFIGGLLACTGATHNSAGTEVYCTVPPNAYGTVANLSVTVNGVWDFPAPGIAPPTFSYTPRLTVLAPTTGPELQPLLITGIGLNSPVYASTISVAGVVCATGPAVLVTTVSGATQQAVGCNTPSGALYPPGTSVPVTLQINGLVSNVLTFTYFPRIDAALPKQGIALTTVTVVGSGFLPGATDVIFESPLGAVNPQTVHIVPVVTSFNSLTFVVPDGMPLGDVYRISIQVTNAGVGYLAASANATFFYLGTPFLLPSNPTSPPSAYNYGGSKVYIFALPPNLFIKNPLLTVRFGPAAGYNVLVPYANITFLSTSIILCDLPPYNASGSVPVTVSNDGLYWSAETTMFRFFSAPVSVIISQQPPAHYSGNGPFAPNAQPKVKVVDKYGQLVDTVNSAFIDATVIYLYRRAALPGELSDGDASGAVEEEASLELRANNIPFALTGSTRTSVTDGVGLYTNLGLTGVHGSTYQIRFDSAGLNSALSSPITVEECYDQRPFSVRDTGYGFTCVCDRGYTPATGGVCIPCGDGYFKSVVGDTPCQSCPANQLTGAGNATSISECYCQDGYFIPTGQTACVPCLDSGICTRSKIYPKPGYWRAPEPLTAESIYLCDATTACDGMLNGACQPGYEGPLCGICAEGLARYNKACAPCGPRVQGILVMIAICILLVCVIVYMIRSALQAYKSKDVSSSDMIKIMVNYLQVLAFMGDFKQLWPDTVSQLFSASNSANASTNIFSIQCVLKTDFYGNLLINFLIPVGIVIIPAIVVGVWIGSRMGGCLSCKACKAPRHPWKDFRSIYRVSVLVLIFFTHPSITGNMLAALNCREINGVSYVSSDFNVVCSGTKYTNWARAALAFLCLYCFGIILVGIYVLFRVRNKLETRRVQRYYSFLTHGFVPARFFWEMVILFRKTVLIVVKIMLDTKPFAQVYCGLWVFSVAIVAHFKARPFMTPVLMRMETVSLGATFITLLLAMVYLAQNLAADDYRAVLGITVILMTLTICVILWMLYNIIRALYEEKRKKIPKSIRRKCGCRIDPDEVTGQSYESSSESYTEGGHLKAGKRLPGDATSSASQVEGMGMGKPLLPPGDELFDPTDPRHVLNKGGRSDTEKSAPGGKIRPAFIVVKNGSDDSDSSSTGGSSTRNDSTKSSARSSAKSSARSAASVQSSAATAPTVKATASSAASAASAGTTRSGAVRMTALDTARMAPENSSRTSSTASAGSAEALVKKGGKGAAKGVKAPKSPKTDKVAALKDKDKSAAASPRTGPTIGGAAASSVSAGSAGAAEKKTEASAKKSSSSSDSSTATAK